MPRLEGGGGGAPVALGGTVRPPPPSLWRTPTPYLFLGFAFLMGLIAVALLVLLCTRRKPSRRGADDESGSARAVTLAPLHREELKVVVFMPGDHRAPSFLASARPLSVAAPGAEARDGGGGGATTV